jgi:Fe-S cluster assembly ATP-binding protein
MNKIKHYLPLIAILIIGTILRFYHNTDISLWHDEAFSALLIKYSWGEMFYRIGLDVSLLGEATFLGEPLLGAVHERAQQGISLVFQQPVALPGVTVLGMLRAMRVGPTGEAVGYGVLLAEVRPLLARLALPEEVLERQVHVDFSGGERKMLELLFLLWARPKLALVDEVEAGLDGEHRALALRILSDLRSAGAGILLVSHDSAFAEALQPTREMVLV